MQISQSVTVACSLVNNVILLPIQIVISELLEFFAVLNTYIHPASRQVIDRDEDSQSHIMCCYVVQAEFNNNAKNSRHRSKTQRPGWAFLMVTSSAILV